jgi:hypothetical protein
MGQRDANLHQKIVILFDDCETVMGRELDVNGRFNRGLSLSPMPVTALALACDRNFNAKPQYFCESLISSKPVSLLASRSWLSLEFTHVLEQPMP